MSHILFCAECQGSSDDCVSYCRKCNENDINNNRGMAFAIEQLEAEAKPLRAREPLVQEVIQEFKNILCDYTRMTDLLNAVRKLAEHKHG